MSIQHINKVENGPKPAGPYSLGIVAEGKFLFISGQGPFDPEKNAMVLGTIAEQTELTLRNVERIVRAGGGSLANVVNCRVYLQPLTRETFNEMNAVYEKFFGEHKPTRTTIGATLLGMDVEIDCVVKIA